MSYPYLVEVLTLHLPKDHRSWCLPRPPNAPFSSNQCVATTPPVLSTADGGNENEGTKPVGFGRSAELRQGDQDQPGCPAAKGQLGQQGLLFGLPWLVRKRIGWV